MPGEGMREGTIGSLLTGYYDSTQEETATYGRSQKLIYAGNVGTGLTNAELVRLQHYLQPLIRPTSPFSGSQVKGAVYTEPELVCDVEFTEWTQGGIMRHPSFKGLRFDKEPHEVVREKRTAPGPAEDKGG